MRRPIIAGNWKMNKTIEEAVSIAVGLKRKFYTFSEADIVICPPFTALSKVHDQILDSSIMLGAQDMHWEESGALTGEISPGMLKDVGCRYIITGHSERRTIFGETDEDVNKKLKVILKHGMIPIMCIGEQLDERDNGMMFEVLEKQLTRDLKGLTKEQAVRIIIAYEPIWAIGTGRTATPQQAQEAHKYIRDFIERLYDRDTAVRIRIQYGGSVKPDNIAQLMAQEDVDGALVGGASLDVNSFTEIVEKAVL
ncbi:MAG: triose-phosphate isomerase [Candidatus Omnitrophica bacterium]|nr:triose-phosphate isomerase [Candidatus Omnitrophota bacterium]MBU1932374.1 triose-phosphate isomerase [Candidatus Omnitrophota bacterium]